MAQPGHQPQRKCVACGERSPKRGLLRLVRTPAGGLQVDPTGRLSGRGAYLCRSQTCWEQALRRPGRLEQALRWTISAEERERLVQAIQAVMSP
ncbi:MAG: YlxR family protein [Dehalococcoidia bacterium]|nr:YlxR family protein [Dehalococcoidia bacterium]